MECTESEFQRLSPPEGQSCVDFLQPYLVANEGYLENPSALENCGYCRLRETNEFLAGQGIVYGNRWRDWGILCSYVVFNVAAALGLYWLVRVPKRSGKRGRR